MGARGNMRSTPLLVSYYPVLGVITPIASVRWRTVVVAFIQGEAIKGHVLRLKVALA